MGMKRWVTIAVVVAIMAWMKGLSSQLGFEKEAAIEWLKLMSDRLGNWAIPAYVALHTITLALCLPYAVFFEAGASLLFGFLPAVLCVFSAKILGASLSFSIGSGGSDNRSDERIKQPIEFRKRGSN
ncbi:hypothetical protein MTR67_048428 [Solanum verrucosum]|uniref:SNARE associated Golgi protein n=1 Tax=Solanum verrucosum TaxID=315347 RepID=A0AAF0UXY1_SOLVR|nr:hypothetical protein MTR67_048428 [Solanum verrucosum]